MSLKRCREVKLAWKRELRDTARHKGLVGKIKTIYLERGWPSWPSSSYSFLRLAPPNQTIPSEPATLLVMCRGGRAGQVQDKADHAAKRIGSVGPDKRLLLVEVFRWRRSEAQAAWLHSLALATAKCRLRCGLRALIAVVLSRRRASGSVQRRRTGG